MQGLLFTKSIWKETGDPDTVLHTIELTLSMVDSATGYAQSERILRDIRTQLVSLFEHWRVLQCHLPPCTVLAVGVGSRHSSYAGQKGRPPVFVNVSMVEYLRGNGYTWDEIARSMLVGRTTMWRKLREAGNSNTLDRYSNISEIEPAVPAKIAKPRLSLGHHHLVLCIAHKMSPQANQFVWTTVISSVGISARSSGVSLVD